MPFILNFKWLTSCPLCKDAPKYGVDGYEEVCAFIDQYITCAIAEAEGKLKDLSYCFSNNTNTLPIAKETKLAVLAFRNHLVQGH